MTLPTSRPRSLLASLLVFTAGLTATAAPEFSIPAKQIDVTGAKYLKTSKRILLPTVNLEVLNWGKITSVTQTSALQTLGGADTSTARSTMEVTIPSDVPALRAVAADLYTDLATKLRTAGWEVITYDEAKAFPALANIKQESVDSQIGAPVKKVNLGKQKIHYTQIAPPGMPTMNPGFTMPMWGLRSLLAEQSTHALETTYRFDTVALMAEGRHGIGRNTASTNAEANLVLTWADAFFLSNKLAGGNVRLKNPQTVVGGVGEIKKTSDASPNVANGLSKGLSMIAGGAINSSKGLYVAELNQDALKASLLAAGKAFNDEIVKGLGTPQ
jgi:hypothetical protein